MNSQQSNLCFEAGKHHSFTLLQGKLIDGLEIATVLNMEKKVGYDAMAEVIRKHCPANVIDKDLELAAAPDLAELLGCSEAEATQCIQFFIFNQVLALYVQMSVQRAAEDTLENRRFEREARRAVGELMVEFGGIGEHQTEMFLRQFDTQFQNEVANIIGSAPTR